MLHYLPEKFRYILKSMSQLLHRTGVQKVLEIITAQTLVNIYKTMDSIVVELSTV